MRRIRLVGTGHLPSSPASPGPFGEGVQRGKHFRRPPDSVARPVGGLDEDSEALTGYRAGDAAPLVECFSRASSRAIGNGRLLVSDLRDIRRRWNDEITARSDSAVWKLADLLTRRPVVNAALLAAELGIDSTNAHRYLTPLTEA